MFFGHSNTHTHNEILPQSKLINIFSQDIFIVEHNNPDDIRPGNDFDAGEYEYDYYDEESQPDLSNPERISGASNKQSKTPLTKVSGAVRYYEIFNWKRDMVLMWLTIQ